MVAPGNNRGLLASAEAEQHHRETLEKNLAYYREHRHHYWPHD